MTTPQSTDVQLAVIRGQLDTINTKLDSQREAANVQTRQASREAEEAKRVAETVALDLERSTQALRDTFDQKLSTVRVDLEGKIKEQSAKVGTLLDFRARILGALALAVVVEAGATALLIQALK
ncbi:MAG: hypothetical protein M3O32_17130 [Actinomycetota bacterium]|nr:hypothetical protein [Actinomycetota bacterium]